MSNYDDTNRGALFKNDKKEKETHPDYRGPMNFNGQDGYLAAWMRESRDGKKYMSLKWQPKDDAPKAQQEPQQGGGGFELDDEVPF